MQAPVRLEAYQVLDLSVEYKIRGNLRTFLDIRNLTDARYFDVLGFSARPLHFLTGVRWSH
jgi:outer membrane receptor protein involved in Fe transport